MNQVYAGTSGFSDREWQEPFCPWIEPLMVESFLKSIARHKTLGVS